VPDPRPLVYCSLGTQSLNYGEARSVLMAIIAAFDGLPGYQLLMAATALYDDLSEEPLPENVRLVASAPQLSVLERAAAIITHGGMSTIKEAIMASVPSIVIPFAYDQPANGRRVEYHGLGRACAPPSCRPETLREIVLDVAGHQAWRRRVAAMSAIFWQRESECRAGHLLLDALAGHDR
jgi:MGT family glycosyltransferase